MINLHTRKGRDNLAKLIALTIVAVFGFLTVVQAAGEKGEENADNSQRIFNIADSAVHGDLPVSMVLSAEEVKEDDNGRSIQDDLRSGSGGISDGVSDPGDSGNDPDNIVPDNDDPGQKETEIDIYKLDVWDLGAYLYGISYLDTSRALKLITYEGYGGSPLSYYVAACCWTRIMYPENFGGSDLYERFGGADLQYGDWMDSLGIADYAYTALWQCYMDPMYVTYCNGVTVPEDYIYCEFDGAYWIYVWN